MARRDGEARFDRPGTPRLGRAALLWGLAIVLASFAVYAPSYRYDPARHEGFVWDDDDHFLNDPLIRADDGWWRVFADPHPGIVGEAGGAVVWNYWPVTRLSFWIDRHLWGTDARGLPDLVAARLANVALHALCALLLAITLSQLGVPGAWLAGLLYAVHPVVVESVAWITERKAVLATALFFVSLFGWLRFEESGRRRWYLFTSVAYVATLLAKSSTVMFPVVLVGLRWWARRPFDARTVAQLAPFFAMSAVSGVTSIVFERYVIGSQGGIFESSLAERFATAGWITWFYLAKALVPIGVSFNYPRFEVDPTAWLHYAPSAALLVCAAILWRYREGWARGWLLAFGTFAANLFPVMSFFGVYGMRYAHVADHWFHLALASVLAFEATLAVWLVRRVARSRPSLARLATALGGAAAIAVVVGFGVGSARHAAAFVDRESLWQHTLATAPDSYLANNNLGVLRLAAGRHDEALRYFQRAVEAEPEYAEAWVNVGNALDASGRKHEAVRHWERAVELDPKQGIAWYNLAVAHVGEGRLDAAESLLKRALTIDVRDARALEALRYVYEQQGRGAAIEPFFERARQAPAIDRAARGRIFAYATGAVYALLLAACVAVSRPERPAAR